MSLCMFNLIYPFMRRFYFIWKFIENVCAQAMKSTVQCRRIDADENQRF